VDLTLGSDNSIVLLLALSGVEVRRERRRPSVGVEGAVKESWKAGFDGLRLCIELVVR
jgi:hypothetical protein